MVVFIDDLDRCSPEKVMEILEGIKVCPNLEGIVLVGKILRGINLARANLKGADLRLTSLKGADLEGAILKGVNMGANSSLLDQF